MHREESLHLAAGPEIDCKGQPPTADWIVAEKAAHEEYLVAIVQLSVQMSNLYKKGQHSTAQNSTIMLTVHHSKRIIKTCPILFVIIMSRAKAMSSSRTPSHGFSFITSLPKDEATIDPLRRPPSDCRRSQL